MFCINIKYLCIIYNLYLVINKNSLNEYYFINNLIHNLYKVVLYVPHT